jgi:hypothetical protein
MQPDLTAAWEWRQSGPRHQAEGNFTVRHDLNRDQFLNLIDNLRPDLQDRLTLDTLRSERRKPRDFRLPSIEAQVTRLGILAPVR